MDMSEDAPEQYLMALPKFEEKDLPKVVTKSGTEKPLVSELQAQIVELISVRGHKRQHVAEALGITPSSVTYHLNRDNVKEYQKILVQDRLSSLAVTSTSKLASLLNHKSGYISMEAIKLIMNASGNMNDNKGLQVSTSGQTIVNIDLGG